MISDFHGPVLTSSINGEPFVDAAVVTLSREALKSSETISLVLISAGKWSFVESRCHLQFIPTNKVSSFQWSKRLGP